MNLVANKPAVVIANKTISFKAAGFTSNNLFRIYSVSDLLRSYEPDRAFNSITGFIKGGGYYIIPKSNILIGGETVANPFTATIEDYQFPTLPAKSPSGLSWSQVATYRITDYQPESFVAVRLNSISTNHDFVLLQNSGLVAYSNSFRPRFVMSDEASASMIFYPYPTISWWTMNVDVNQLTGSGDVFIGIIRDENNYAGCVYRTSTNQVWAKGVKDGSITENSKTIISGSVKKVRVVCTGSFITIIVIKSDNTEVETIPFTYEMRGLDYYNGDYKYGVTISSTSAFDIQFNEVVAGNFGCTAVGDNGILQTDKGTPLIIDNKLYWTASLRGFTKSTSLPDLLANNGQGILAMDLDTYQSEIVSLIWLNDGYKVQGEGSPCFVYDTTTKTFRCFMTAWHLATDGNAHGVRLTYKETTKYLLCGVHIINQVSLITPDPGAPTGDAYDSGWVKSNGYWYVGYSQQSSSQQYHFKLARTTDFINFQLVFEDSLTNQYEGVKAAKIGANLYLIGSAPEHIKFFNLTGGAVAEVANVISTYPANHAAICAIPKDGTIKYLWISFNGELHNDETFTYGTTVIYLSE